MFIKRLELLGFKTFADKTAIEIGEGITGIVGPNGCGKSNIVDAIMWVLGESNVRNLRGQRITDVIFNGSEKRRSHGMAEVTLTLDNSEGRLPVGFSEVAVTRRTYRSGESEYLINNTRCRLKDIYELFLDTGVGKEAYSIVTQGEIDAVLSARPEDRRELFEEAAGIRKYRYRREEALRKLERTEQSLRRVCDIMAELESQVEPLAAQSEQARRYAELQSRLWDIEIGLLIRDLKRYSSTLEEVRAAKADAAEQVSLNDLRIAELEERKEAQTATLASLDEKLDGARRIHQTITANVQRLESKAELLQERARSIESSKQRLREENALTERRIAESTSKIATLQIELAKSEQARASAKEAAEKLKTELAELEHKAAELSGSLDRRKASRAELEAELSVKRHALANLEQRESELQIGVERLIRQIEQLEDESREAESAETTARELLKQAKARAQEAQARIESSSAVLRELDERTSMCSEELAAIERDLVSKSSRLAALREMVEAGEGLSEGVKNVVAAAKEGKLNGNFTVLADILDVRKGYEVAIETALGPSAQDILVAGVSEARRAISYLAENQLGRATFRPLDSEGSFLQDLELPTGKGYIAIASDLVECRPEHAQVVRRLLGRTIVVTDLASALAVAERISGWDKIVTVSGELVLPGGVISGGKSKSRSLGLVERKAEMDSLRADVATLEKRAAEARCVLERLRAESANERQMQESARKSLFNEQAESAKLEKTVELNRQFAANARLRIEALATSRAETEELMAEARTQAASLRDELDAFDTQTGSMGDDLAAAEQEASEVIGERDAKRHELARLNIEAAGLSERVVALERSLEEARKLLAELEESLGEHQARIEAISSDESVVAEDLARVGKEIASQRELLQAASHRLDELAGRRTEVATALSTTESHLREAYSNCSGYAESAHDAEVREARLEVQIAQIRERLLTEYELTYEQAMAWPDEDIEVERGAAAEVARLRREIRDMGPVNTGAIQEYERIKERWDFLSAQRADLEKAKMQINEAIAEIDAKTRNMFLETFESAVTGFDEIFNRLFGGGKAELSLADPKNPLESGINVAVQPPGKKMQDLALLSGGERALTAAALVFALLKIKPSPFVLMDEIDAALDESNVERFAQVVREFARESQFVVVTHNRATMEAAERLYGVTMEEPGVSKLISVRLAAEGPVERELETVPPG